MKEKHAGGRPPKGDASQTARIHLRAIPDEKARFEKAARKAGVSLADWMKDRLNQSADRELGK